MIKFRKFLQEDLQKCLIHEELSPTQKRHVDAMTSDQRDVSFTDHMFGPDNHTIVIPFKNEEKPHASLVKHLADHGYEIHDYQKGLARRIGSQDEKTPEGKKKNPRLTRIGTILDKTAPHNMIYPDMEMRPDKVDTWREAVDSFNKRETHDMQILLTRHPHKVAEMSTNKAWRSCLALGTCGADISEFGGEMPRNPEAGVNAHRVGDDVNSGTHVAYLIRSGDTDLKDPIARLAFKHFKTSDGSHHVLLPDNAYHANKNSDLVDQFTDQATEHINKQHNNHQPSGDYRVARDPDTNFPPYMDNYTSSHVHKRFTEDYFDENNKQFDVANWNSIPTAQLIQHLQRPTLHRDALTHLIENRGSWDLNQNTDRINQLLVNHPKFTNEMFNKLVSSDRFVHGVVKHAVHARNNKNIDLTPHISDIIKNGVFGELKDPEIFNSVVTPERLRSALSPESEKHITAHWLDTVPMTSKHHDVVIEHLAKHRPYELPSYIRNNGATISKRSENGLTHENIDHAIKISDDSIKSNIVSADNRNMQESIYNRPILSSNHISNIIKHADREKEKEGEFKSSLHIPSLVAHPNFQLEHYKPVFDLLSHENMKKRYGLTNAHESLVKSLYKNHPKHADEIFKAAVDSTNDDGVLRDLSYAHGEATKTRENPARQKREALSRKR